MINSIELSDRLKYKELNQLIIDFIQTYPWIGTTSIENKIKHNYSKIDFLTALKLHKDDLNFPWGEILYFGPYANEINDNDIWELKDHINWQQFTKNLYNLYNLHSIAKYAFIKRFKDYLDWNYLRKLQLYYPVD